jgi:putative Ca2+/H+ antiporter (TMEM165/GDT1 family)
MPSDPGPLLAWLTVGGSAFGLIFLAEMGDKSQLVCMTLAARHRHGPVLAGAIVAFLLLNTLAVVFGAGLALWIPERLLATLVGILFAVFGVLSLRTPATQPDTDAEVAESPGHGIFFTTLLMLVLAEMGDKTQIAVAGMASTQPPLPVWVGASLALTATSAIGVVVGTRILRRVSMHRVHQVSGVLFLVLAALALGRALWP